MILLTILAMVFIIGLEITSGQQYFSFEGRVVTISRGDIAVEGNRGEIMNFAVGRRTNYIPRRLPGVGERGEGELPFSEGAQRGLSS